MRRLAPEVGLLLWSASVIVVMLLWLFPLLWLLQATFPMQWGGWPLLIIGSSILLLAVVSAALGSMLRWLSAATTNIAVLVGAMMAGPMFAGWAAAASPELRVALTHWSDGRATYYLLYFGTWLATLAYMMKIPWDRVTEIGRDWLRDRYPLGAPAGETGRGVAEEGPTGGPDASPPDPEADSRHGGAPWSTFFGGSATEKEALGARLAELRIEEYRYYLEEQRHLWLSGKEWALTTVRLLLTANGGAVVAALALIGAISKDGRFPFPVAPAGWGLGFFCAGVVLATLAAGISTIYFSMLWRALPSTENVERRTTQLLIQEGTALEPFQRNQRLRTRAWRYMLASMVTASLSAVCFVAGAGLLATAFFGR